MTSGSLLSKNSDVRVILGQQNKGSLYNCITNKTQDLKIVDDSYTQTIADRAHLIDTNLGKLAFFKTAADFPRSSIQINALDAYVMHVAYFDNAKTPDTTETNFQIYNSTISELIAEGSFTFESACGTVKVMTLHFIANVSSSGLAFRMVGRTDVVILGVAIKNLGTSDGVTDKRFDSDLAMPRLVNYSDVSVTTTFDPPSIAANSMIVTDVTMYGVKVGDIVSASFSNYNANIDIVAVVSATDTVTVKFKNNSAGAIDLASGTLTVKLF